MNRYEELFDQFIECIEFELVKYEDGWGLSDCTGANFGDIEHDRFNSAWVLLDRLDNYIYDYIVSAMEDCLVEKGYELYKGTWDGLPAYCKDKIPESKWDIEVIDMICNHYDEIDLNNCTYLAPHCNNKEFCKHCDLQYSCNTYKREE